MICPLTVIPVQAFSLDEKISDGDALQVIISLTQFIAYRSIHSF